MLKNSAMVGFMSVIGKVSTSHSSRVDEFFKHNVILLVMDESFLRTANYINSFLENSSTLGTQVDHNLPRNFHEFVFPNWVGRGCHAITG